MNYNEIFFKEGFFAYVLTFAGIKLETFGFYFCKFGCYNSSFNRNLYFHKKRIKRKKKIILKRTFLYLIFIISSYNSRIYYKLKLLLKVVVLALLIYIFVFRASRLF